MSSPGSPTQGPVERTQMLAISNVHISLPLDFREHLETIDTDITDSERESVRLTRKLNKRLSGSRTDLMPSEYFLDKLSRWHNNSKVEKLKSLFAIHMPKVKQIEDEVVCGVTAVAANKETVLRQAYVILSLVDKQIEYYQNHANFLDDVINDIRECDFTLVREISEMKVAYTFSQELEAAARPRNSNNRSPSVDPKTVLLKIGVDSTGHVPGRRVLEDDAQVLSILTSAHCGVKSPVTELLLQEPGVDIPILHLQRSSKQKTLPTTTNTVHNNSSSSSVSTNNTASSINNSSSVDRSQRKEEDETAAEVGLIALSKSNSSDSSSSYSSTHSITITPTTSTTTNTVDSNNSGRISPEHFYSINNNNNPNTSASNNNSINTCSQRDGADYKRKCLKSCSVNLQTLNLHNNNNNNNTKTAAITSDCKSPTVTSPVNGLFRALGNAFQKKNDIKNNEEKRNNEKRRSLSVSSGFNYNSTINNMGNEREIQEISKRSSLTKSASLGEVLGYKQENGKNCLNRTGSVGSNVIIPSTQYNSMKPPMIEVSQLTTAGAGSAPVLKLTHPHATTPRPVSYSSNTATTSSTSVSIIHSSTSQEMHSCLSPHSTAVAINSSSCLSPPTSAGIAFETQPSSAVRGPDRVLPPTPSTHPTTHSSTNSSNTQLAGQLSASSSCSNLSLTSLTAAETAAERRRLKYAALLAHCPQIYQSATAQSEPGIRLLARKLNKCLKFKDELKRTLVKAELVQETENSCLCKMRKVQHELQDLMVDEPTPTSRLYSISASVSPEPSSLVEIHPLRHSHFTAISSSTASESHDEVHHHPHGMLHTGHVRFSEESLCNAAVERDQRSAEFPTKQHPMFARLHLTDHELSSSGTDDEHDHMTTGSYNSQHSHGNSSSSSYGLLHHDDDTPPPPQSTQSPKQRRATVPSECGVSTVSTEVPGDSTPGSHCRDPAIIDPCQDAAVNQISAELYELAHRCAQNLQELQDEEHDMASKLARVRQLLNSAHLIDTQLLTALASK